MQRVNENWYECEQGHITAGTGDKKKCEAEGYMTHYTKGKRKASWNGEVTKLDKKCGAPLIKKGDIPLQLDYFQVWDHETMHAFLIGQKFDSHFMIGLQQAFTKMKEAIDGKEILKAAK